MFVEMHLSPWMITFSQVYFIFSLSVITNTLKHYKSQLQQWVGKSWANEHYGMETVCLILFKLLLIMKHYADMTTLRHLITQIANAQNSYFRTHYEHACCLAE